jgi:hypothetical protein
MAIGLFAIFVSVALLIFGWTFVTIRNLDYSATEAHLGAIQVPPVWELVHTERDAFYFSPRITRFYLVDGNPDAISATWPALLESSGVAVDEETHCNRNGPDGPMSCFIRAHRGQTSLDLLVLDRGQTLPVRSRGPLVGAPGLAVVRIVAIGESAVASGESSPTRPS